MLMRRVLFHLHRSRKKSNKIWLMSNLSVVPWCTFFPVTYPPLTQSLYPPTMHIHGAPPWMMARKKRSPALPWCNRHLFLLWIFVWRDYTGDEGVGGWKQQQGGKEIAWVALKHNKLIIVINILPLSWHPLERISCLWMATRDSRSSGAQHRYPDYEGQMTKELNYIYWKVAPALTSKQESQCFIHPPSQRHHPG